MRFGNPFKRRDDDEGARAPSPGGPSAPKARPTTPDDLGAMLSSNPPQYIPPASAAGHFSTTDEEHDLVDGRTPDGGLVNLTLTERERETLLRWLPDAEPWRPPELLELRRRIASRPVWTGEGNPLEAQAARVKELEAQVDRLQALLRSLEDQLTNIASDLVLEEEHSQEWRDELAEARKEIAHLRGRLHGAPPGFEDHPAFQPKEGED